MRTGKAGLVGAWVCLLLWTPAAGLAQSPPMDGQDRPEEAVSRPAWAVEGMPDTVRVLVEASSAAGNDDRAKALLVDAERLARVEALRTPDDVPRRFALAVVLGLRADREGGKTRSRPRPTSTASSWPSWSAIRSTPGLGTCWAVSTPASAG